MIKIVGLGPGSIDDLTIKSIKLMENANNLYLRTAIHPNVEYIRNKGIAFETFDDIYNKEESFDAVYQKIAEKIVMTKDVVYAVPGHPLVAEKSVRLIIDLAEKEGIEVEIIPALSFVDAIITTLKIDPVNGLKIIDALQMDEQRPDINVGNIVTQVYNRMVASDVKLKLSEVYGDEFEVYLVRGAGVEGIEKIEKLPLYEIDRRDWVDYLTSLYIPPCKEGENYDFNSLLGVMENLRGEDGCPWDIEQTHESLKRYLLEECYEVLEAIDKDEPELLMEELGDLLLQIVFHSQIARENGYFNIHDVVKGITEKMKRRHPHVFGELKCETPDDVIDIWERNKIKEKDIKSHLDRLKSVPSDMPALMRSYKIQEKAADVGFDWDDVKGAILKLEEELGEFLEVYNAEDMEKSTEEFGDLLFAAVNVARFLKINPEFALTKTIEKFINRFGYIEKSAMETGRTLEKMTLEEMDELWNKAKSIEIKKN